MKKCLNTIIICLSAFYAQYSGAQSLNISQIALQNDLIGASAVVFCSDQVIAQTHIGLSDYQRQLPISDSTFFRSASVSKLITAMAFMTLVDSGLIGLDDHIGFVLGYPVVNPNYPNAHITPRQLLSHTSTIIDGPLYANFLTATYQSNAVPNLYEILMPNGLFYDPLNFNNTLPGTYFNYSNLNYIILGTLIEKVTQQGFNEYTREHLFMPLGIDGSYLVNDLPDMNRLAVLYRKINGTWTPQVDDYQGIPPAQPSLANYVPGTNAGVFAPQGGLRVSTLEMTRLLQVLMNDGMWNGVSILSSTSVKEMLTNEWSYNGSNGNTYGNLFRSWGLGAHRITATLGGDLVLPGSTAMFGHSGEAYGLISDAYMDTTRGIGFVFFTNGSGNGYQLSSQSAFYTVEDQVFNWVESIWNSVGCSDLNNEPFDEKIGLAVYPNPTKGTLTVEHHGGLGVLEISSVHGNRVHVAHVAESTWLSDLSHLPEGLYFLKIKNGAVIHTEKIILRK